MSDEKKAAYLAEKLRELAKGLVHLEDRYDENPLPVVPPSKMSPEILAGHKEDARLDREVWEGVLRLMEGNPKWEWAVAGIEWLQDALEDPPIECLCDEEDCPAPMFTYYNLRWGSESLRKTLLSLPDLYFSDLSASSDGPSEEDRLEYDIAAVELHLLGHLLGPDSPSWQRWESLTKPRWETMLTYLQSKLLRRPKSGYIEMGSGSKMEYIKLTEDEADLMQKKILPRTVLKGLPERALEILLERGFVPEGLPN